jgi:hypothetical protein
MAGKKAISDEVRASVEARVAQFNQAEVEDPHQYFSVRFRGKYAYLDRDEYGHLGPRARLTYTGDLEHWDFAIYKYSDNGYDPDEWFFPGAQHVDGTIEGALRAAMLAYP